MPPLTLHDFLHADEHGGDSIAGYLEPNAGSPNGPWRFVHWRSSNPMLAAFIDCLEGGGDMRRIYTNHERTPWVRPRGPGVKRRGVLRPDEGDGSLPIEPVPMTNRARPASVAVPAGPAPLAKGLHAMAESSPAHAPAPSPLRHYALAARTLIARSAASGFAGVHDHVGAMLVGDDGAILAAGINTGSYRHAEVNLLQAWFRAHPEARTLPARSIVLSTLTPCRQCTRYLSLARAPDTLVRFDEADAGRSGRVGERIAERLVIGADRPVRSSPGDPDPGSMTPVRGAQRRALRNGEREGDGGGRKGRNGEDGPDDAGGRSRIDRSREARRALLDAADAADADRGTNGGERSDDAAVLAYLARWLRDAAHVAPRR